MIHGGWTRQGVVSINQYDPGSVEGALEEEMFPGGWNSQIETKNEEYYPDPVKNGLVDGLVKGRPSIPIIIQA